MKAQVLLVENCQAFTVRSYRSSSRRGFDRRFRDGWRRRFYHQRTFRLLILNLRLRIATVLTFVATFGLAGIKTPILLLTAACPTGHKVMALKPGPDAHLTKRFSPE